MESRVKRKRKIYSCILIVAIIVVVIWGYQVYKINKIIPQTKKIVMQGEQWNPWKNGIEIKAKKMEFTKDSWIREHIQDEESLYEHEMRLLWVQFDIRNQSEEEQNIDLLDIGVESSGWCNIADVELYYQLSDSPKELNFTLKSGEEVSYKLPFLMVKANFRNSEWKKIEDKQYYAVLKLYPEKRMIQI